MNNLCKSIHQQQFNEITTSADILFSLSSAYFTELYEFTQFQWCRQDPETKQNENMYHVVAVAELCVALA